MVKMSKSEALEIIDNRLKTISELVNSSSNVVATLKTEIRELRASAEKLQKLREQVIKEN